MTGVMTLAGLEKVQFLHMKSGNFRGETGLSPSVFKNDFPCFIWRNTEAPEKLLSFLLHYFACMGHYFNTCVKCKSLN